MSLSPAQQARQRLGGAIRRGDPDDIDAARAALDEAKIDAKIAEIIDRAPDLTDAQYRALAAALGVDPVYPRVAS
jgi:hypothetical protein